MPTALRSLLGIPFFVAATSEATGWAKMSDRQSQPEPLELLTAAEMRRWDVRSIERIGIPERVLMESAGRTAARVLTDLYPRGRVVAAVGRGNNGGDALVLLRTLRAWGREVLAVLVGRAALPRDLLHGWEIPTVDGGGAADAFRDAGVVVDGILGTGAEGPLREPQAGMVRAINGSGRPVVALDGPTGVDLTTGRAAGEAVRAEVTIAFGAPKRGHVLFPGREHAGRIVVVEVGFPPADASEVSARLITRGWASARFPHLRRNAHKGGAGTLAVVAGHPGMGGAAILVAMGALRTGTGKVRMVSHDANRVPIQTVVPEALFVDRAGGGVEGVVESADAVVVGPGMGTDEDALGLLRLALECATAPILLDADAVTMISRDPDLLAGAEAGRILLTPHPGEMARLMGMETADVVADPFGAARSAAERFGCTILLKGFPSIVASPGEAALVNVAGHSGIATSGMGDTLAGIVAALLARGSAPREAAAVGIFVAGRAAEQVGRGRPVLPRDVADALPRALAFEADAGTLSLPEVRLELPAAS